MKIAVVHNTYQQPGGEDVVVAAESALLERNGHKVVRYSRSNDEITAMSRPEQLLMVKDLIYSERSKQELFAMLQCERPDARGRSASSSRRSRRRRPRGSAP